MQFFMPDENPKSHPTDNADKDPDSWVSDDDPEAFDETISKAEASKSIDALKSKLRLE